jgi:hypothetical protein
MSSLGINFIEHRRTLSAVAVLTAFVGAGALAAVSLLWLQVDTERQGLQVAHQRLVSTEKKKGKSSAAKPATVAANTAVNKPLQVRSALEQPWPEVLDAIALAARETSVGLIGLDAQGQNRTMLIIAESKDLAGALQWVRNLRNHSLFQSASLTGHEMRNDSAGQHIRFTVELVWRAPL